jgi:hypothetical protein
VLIRPDAAICRTDCLNPIPLKDEKNNVWRGVGSVGIADAGALSYSTTLSTIKDLPLHQNEYPDGMRIWDQSSSVQQYFLMALISLSHYRSACTLLSRAI